MNTHDHCHRTDETGQHWYEQACRLASWTPHALAHAADLKETVVSGAPLARAIQDKWQVRRATLRRMFRLGNTALQGWQYVPEALALALDRLPAAWHPDSDEDWILWGGMLQEIVARGGDGHLAATLMPLAARADKLGNGAPLVPPNWILATAMLASFLHDLAPQVPRRQREDALVAALLRRRPEAVLDLSQEVEQALFARFGSTLQGTIAATGRDVYPSLWPAALWETPLRVEPLASLSALLSLSLSTGNCLHQHLPRLAMGHAAYYSLSSHDEAAAKAIFCVRLFSHGQRPLLYDVRGIDNRPAMLAARSSAESFVANLANEPASTFQHHIEACRAHTTALLGGDSFRAAWQQAIAAALPRDLVSHLNGHGTSTLPPQSQLATGQSGAQGDAS